MAFPRRIAGLPSAATMSDFDEGTVIFLLAPLSYAIGNHESSSPLGLRSGESFR